jgi:hypothetical protein
VKPGIEQRPWFGRFQHQHRLGELRAIVGQSGGSRREVAGAGRRADTMERKQLTVSMCCRKPTRWRRS